MTPSNGHPQIVPRRLRRAFLLPAACGLLTALLADPAPALAQNLIEFSVYTGSPWPQYEVRDDGMGLQQLAFPQNATFRFFSTARSVYPGGRQYLYVQQNRVVKTKRSTYYFNDLLVWSQGSGQSKLLATFQNQASVSFNTARWSNDGIDSFVSFMVYNPFTRQSATYRAHISAADIGSPTFVPITSLSDPRLEFVADWGTTGGGYSYWWGGDGSRLFYVDSRDNFTVRAKTVGVGATIDDDPIVFVSPVAGMGLAQLRVIPPVDPLNPDRYLVVQAQVTNGILAIDLATSSWQWLVTASGAGLSDIRSPVFSPDGLSVAFGATRVDSQKFPNAAVYRVPFFGGPITRVTTEFKGSRKGTLPLEVYNWQTP